MILIISDLRLHEISPTMSVYLKKFMPYYGRRTSVDYFGKRVHLSCVWLSIIISPVTWHSVCKKENDCIGSFMECNVLIKCLPMIALLISMTWLDL